jgi:hypothetical protein
MRSILACLLLLASSVAWAHDWYPRECCADFDCEPVFGEAMRDGRYRFIVKGKEYIVDESKVRNSQDERFHACQPPYAERPNCFFRPLVGS